MSATKAFKPVETALNVISAALVFRSQNVVPMQCELMDLLQYGWVDHVNRRDYAGGWDVLPLRCQREYADAHPVLQSFAIESTEAWQDLPVLKVCPSINAFLQGVQCPLKAVRLMRLKAGAEIKPHRDRGLSLEHGEARLHLPLQTSNKIHFRVNGHEVPMRAGELWYINADQEHSVQNLGDEDRINLVIDCEANKWLKDAINRGCSKFCVRVKQAAALRLPTT
jgi:mannose-6-phosphate isomerase-like protein (cupin superfamily)